MPAGGGSATCTNKVCGVACLSTFHGCPGTSICAAAEDAAHCGPMCQSCSGTTHGKGACVADKCAVACDTNYTLCDGSCLDTQSDLKNCGTCGNDCTALPNVNASATGIKCTAGKCGIPPAACISGYGHCSATPQDGCETDLTSTTNCNTCGTKCPAGNPICAPQGCTNSCGISVPTLCGSTCTDLTSDAQHCGDCATACPATQICKSKQCGCAANQNLCGSACKAATDITACGPNCTKCNVPTGGSITCDGTKCGTPTCPNGQQLCNNACIDNNQVCNGSCLGGKFACADGICRDITTVDSCGSSCQPCALQTGATAACNSGACKYTCNTGFSGSPCQPEITNIAVTGAAAASGAGAGNISWVRLVGSTTQTISVVQPSNLYVATNWSASLTTALNQGDCFALHGNENSNPVTRTFAFSNGGATAFNTVSVPAATSGDIILQDSLGDEYTKFCLSGSYVTATQVNPHIETIRITGVAQNGGGSV